MLVTNPIKKDDVREADILTKDDSKLPGERYHCSGLRDNGKSKGCNQGVLGMKESNSSGASLDNLREKIELETFYDVNNFQMPPLANEPKTGMDVERCTKSVAVMDPTKVDVENSDSRHESGSKFYGVSKALNGWEAKICGFVIGMYNSEWMAADRIDYEMDKLQVDSRYRNRSECDEILEEMRRQDGNQHWVQSVNEHRDYWLACVQNQDNRFQPLVANTLCAKYNPPDNLISNSVSRSQFSNLSLANRASSTSLLSAAVKRTPPTVKFNAAGDGSVDDTDRHPTKDYQHQSMKGKEKRKLFGTKGDSPNRTPSNTDIEESSRKRARNNLETKSTRIQKTKDVHPVSSSNEIVPPNKIDSGECFHLQKSSRKTSIRGKQLRQKKRRSSKYYGVCRFKRGVTRKWLAKCGQKYIGYFVMEDEAASAVDKYLDILGIDKRFRNLGSSKAALEMMSSGKSSKKWKRTYAAKIQAGEVENLSETPDERPLGLLALKCYDKDLEGLGLSLEDIDVEDEPEIREVGKEDRFSLTGGIKSHPLESTKENNTDSPENYHNDTKSRKNITRNKSSFKSLAPDSKTAKAILKSPSNCKVEGGLSTNSEARQKDIAEKKLLLDLMTKTGCRRGVKTEKLSLDSVIESPEINLVEINPFASNTRSTSCRSLCLPGLIPTSQASSSYIAGDEDGSDNVSRDNELGMSLPITSQPTYDTHSEQLPQLRVKSCRGFFRSPAGQCVQTMLLWRSKQLLSVYEYLKGLRMLDGRYGEIIALSSRGLLEIGDIETFRASMEELEEHPIK